MNCVPLMRARPSFAASSIGARPAFASASAARHRLPAGVRLALADEDEREMRERREIAARSQRPARGHHRQHAGPEHVDQKLDELAAHA